MSVRGLFYRALFRGLFYRALLVPRCSEPGHSRSHSLYPNRKTVCLESRLHRPPLPLLLPHLQHRLVSLPPLPPLARQRDTDMPTRQGRDWRPYGALSLYPSSCQPHISLHRPPHQTPDRTPPPGATRCQRFAPSCGGGLASAPAHLELYTGPLGDRQRGQHLRRRWVYSN